MSTILITVSDETDPPRHPLLCTLFRGRPAATRMLVALGSGRAEPNTIGSSACSPSSASQPPPRDGEGTKTHPERARFHLHGGSGHHVCQRLVATHSLTHPPLAPPTAQERRRGLCQACGGYQGRQGAPGVLAAGGQAPHGARWRRLLGLRSAGSAPKGQQEGGGAGSDTCCHSEASAHSPPLLTWRCWAAGAMAVSIKGAGGR